MAIWLAISLILTPSSPSPAVAWSHETPSSSLDCPHLISNGRSLFSKPRHILPMIKTSFRVPHRSLSPNLRPKHRTWARIFHSTSTDQKHLIIPPDHGIPIILPPSLSIQQPLDDLQWSEETSEPFDNNLRDPTSKNPSRCPQNPTALSALILSAPVAATHPLR